MSGYCRNEWEHEDQARRDARWGHRDHDMYDRYTSDPCKEVYTETYDREERRIERQQEERAEEERSERERHSRIEREQREEVGRIDEERYYAAMERAYYDALIEEKRC